MITKEILRENFDYSEDEFFSEDGTHFIGALIWKNPTNRHAKIIKQHGVAVAGSWVQHCAKVYCRIALKGKLFYLHRGVWIYHNGDIPDSHEIDHRESNSFDSRIGSLRCATKWQNRMNVSGQIYGSSRYIGVSRARYGWRARVMFDRQEYASHHKTELAAALARDRIAEQKFGQYAKLNFPELSQW